MLSTLAACLSFSAFVAVRSRRSAESANHEKACQRTISSAPTENAASGDQVPTGTTLIRSPAHTPPGSINLVVDDDEATGDSDDPLDTQPQPASDEESWPESFDGDVVANVITREDLLGTRTHEQASVLGVSTVGRSVVLFQLSVTPLQFKAAMYICSSAHGGKGLFKLRTKHYLNSLEADGEVRQIWPHADSFWKDHAKRQQIVL